MADAWFLPRSLTLTGHAPPKPRFSFTNSPPYKRQRVLTKAIIDNTSITALDAARRLAQFRAQETEQPTPLLTDIYAAALSQDASADTNTDTSRAITQSFDLLATKFIDDNLLKVVSMVNIGRNQEYHQVVLVGDGMCTRAFRLPWPSGTVIYLVAPGEVHERAEAILAVDKVRVPRGCLLRRVDCDLQGGGSCMTSLQRAGYRGDRLSVWALQGIRSLGLDRNAVDVIFSDMSNLAALESILIGELPGCSDKEVDSLLASYGLLGIALSIKAVAAEVAASGSSAALEAWKSGQGGRIDMNEIINENLPLPLMFRGQQRRLSLEEMGVYESHVSAAEEVGEDFDGDFS